LFNLLTLYSTAPLSPCKRRLINFLMMMMRTLIMQENSMLVTNSITMYKICKVIEWNLLHN